ncbi:MAG: D-hexose-6-phosphate mutarotase [Thermodesulfobacteriota bacterium]
MPIVEIKSLNQQYGLDGNLIFKEGSGGLTFAEINNEAASAQIFLRGAHITSFIPHGQEPAFFLSPLSQYETGKAIRGGIPISWPWFADHPTDSSKPAHGFARTSLWEVRGTKIISEAETRIVFGLVDNESTRKMWNYAFDLEFTVSIGKELKSRLTMTNSDNQDFTITSAFHSYYNVGNANDVTIYGLEDANYIDKVDKFAKKIQEGPIRITSETDRIYLDTTSDCLIEDPVLKRKIRVRKTGSKSTVIWNPWIEKSHQMKDLGGQDYTKFVCVETTNAGEDVITISPGKQHKLKMRVAVES